MWTDGDRQFVDLLIGRRRCESNLMGLEGETVQAGYNEAKKYEFDLTGVNRTGFFFF